MVPDHRFRMTWCQLILTKLPSSRPLIWGTTPIKGGGRCTTTGKWRRDWANQCLLSRKSGFKSSPLEYKMASKRIHFKTSRRRRKRTRWSTSWHSVNDRRPTNLKERRRLRARSRKRSLRRMKSHCWKSNTTSCWKHIQAPWKSAIVTNKRHIVPSKCDRIRIMNKSWFSKRKITNIKLLSKSNNWNWMISKSKISYTNRNCSKCSKCKSWTRSFNN